MRVNQAGSNMVVVVQLEPGGLFGEICCVQYCFYCVVVIVL